MAYPFTVNPSNLRSCGVNYEYSPIVQVSLSLACEDYVASIRRPDRLLRTILLQANRIYYLEVRKTVPDVPRGSGSQKHQHNQDQNDTGDHAQYLESDAVDPVSQHDFGDPLSSFNATPSDKGEDAGTQALGAVGYGVVTASLAAVDAIGSATGVGVLATLDGASGGAF